MESHFKFPYRYESIPDLVFELARPSDDKEIVEFLMKYFFPVVPIAEMLSMDCEVEVRPWVLGFIQCVLKSGVSIVVRDESKNSQIIAVRMNDIDYRDSSAGFLLTAFVDEEKHPKMWMNAVLLQDISKGVDLFTMFDVDQILALVMVAVNPDYGNRGLASKLVELNIKLCQKVGIHLLKTEAVNEFAAKALMKYGFHTIKEIDFNTYDYKGTKPVANHPIHNKGRLMALHLK